MNSKATKISRSIVSFLILAVFLSTVVFQTTLHPSGNERYFSGEAEAYYEALLESGFPKDYAISLTELHLLHPNWEFVPLNVTAQDAKHTWSYVIDRETEAEDINLVSKDDTYKAYWHETNRSEPETGYYQPSREAVSYFMDPRNFLSEADIFQFYDLASNSAANLNAIKAVLSGTFMENARLENGTTYAAYFYEIGQELGISPIYLAVKVRQEQGVKGDSPIISGTCGSLLNEYYQNQTAFSESGKAVLPPPDGYTAEQLLALDGLYNFYNIKASGKGLFEIYYQSMERAMEGTPSMSTQWGGTSAWNTRWKSLYGGAHYIKSNYVDRYQSTIYLQKFNVDNRSGRTFWGQYMAALYGALNESRSLYQAFASLDLLDEPTSFLIPVYHGMPEEACPDPANSTCARTARADATYAVQNRLTAPLALFAECSPIYASYSVVSYDSFDLKGSFLHSYGVDALEYRWDDGEWQPLVSGNDVNTKIDAPFAENTSHILTVRGKAAYRHSESAKKNSLYFLCAVIYVEVVPIPTVEVSFRVGNTEEKRTVQAGKELQLPESDAPDFAGWVGSDGSFLPSGATVTVKESVTYSAIFPEFKKLNGAALSLTEGETHLQFSAIMENASWQTLKQRDPQLLSVSATVTDAAGYSKTVTAQISTTQRDGKICFLAQTDRLRPDEYTVNFSVSFFMELHYSNGDSRTLIASGEPFVRSAAQVAQAALEDRTAGYTQEQIAYLKTISNHSN